VRTPDSSRQDLRSTPHSNLAPDCTADIRPGASSMPLSVRGRLQSIDHFAAFHGEGQVVPIVVSRKAFTTIRTICQVGAPLASRYCLAGRAPI
jgi:hypothetical protein